MKKYKHYIFDLYGTLLNSDTDDSLPIVWKYLSWLYALNGAIYTPFELEKKYRDVFKSHMENVAKKYNVQFPENRLEYIFLEILNNAPHTTHIIKKDLSWGIDTALFFRVLTRKSIDIYPKTIETLSSLKNSGANLFLLSNAQRMFAIPEMKSFGLTQFFTKIYISSDYPYKKPQKDFLIKCIDEQKLNVKDCIYVGNDPLFDKRIAESCGMDWILINQKNTNTTIEALLH